MPYFKNIVGQEFAKELFTSSIKSAIDGGEMLSCFMRGQPGLGKTELGETYGRELAEARKATFTMFHSPKEFRLAGAEFDKFLHFMKSPDPQILFVDESHETDETIRCNAFNTFIRKALDPRNNGKEFPVFSQSVVGQEPEEHFGSFDCNDKAIILATNFADKVDPSGALQSRIQMIELVHYSESELVEMQRRAYANAGVNLLEEDADQIMGMIARCGRGTARPITNITKRFRMLFKDDPISFEGAMYAIRLCSYYPRGVTVDEINILQNCIKYARSNTELLALIPNSSVNEIRKSVAYLGSLDYITFKKGVQTTPVGVAFLKNLKKNHFIN